MNAASSERNSSEGANPRLSITIDAKGADTLRKAAAMLRGETPTIADRRQTAMFSDEETGTGFAAQELKQFIERIERLEDEKLGVAGDIKDVFAELKGRGFDAKAVRNILRIRRQDASERQEQEAVLELYMTALGMA